MSEKFIPLSIGNHIIKENFDLLTQEDKDNMIKNGIKFLWGASVVHTHAEKCQSCISYHKWLRFFKLNKIFKCKHCGGVGVIIKRVK